MLVREIVKIFLEDAPLRLRAGRAGAMAGNMDAAGRAAHSLKSTAAALGAVQLKTISARIEELTAANQSQAVDALLDQWDAAFAEAERELSELIAADPV